MKKEIVYLDLFSGAGGFALGLKQAGFKFEKHYFSEIEKNAIANYKYQFKNAIYVGEVNEKGIEKIDRPNLITFGSPCQDISVASRGKGLDGSKSKLFFRAIEIIKQLKPDCFIFENVRNIFSSNKGKDFKKVLETFSELGLYDCQWQLLNSSVLLPQNRERLYLVGYSTKKRTPQIFPLQVAFKANETLTQKGQKNICNIGNAYLSYQTGRVIDSKGISPTLPTDATNFFVKYLGEIRKLTPLEAERLQGFPDDWTRYGEIDNERIEISDTQRYALMGNAVSPPLVKQIALKIVTDNHVSMVTELGLDGIEIQRVKEITARLKGGQLGAPFAPTSNGRVTLDTEVPDAVVFEMDDVLKTIENSSMTIIRVRAKAITIKLKLLNYINNVA